MFMMMSRRLRRLGQQLHPQTTSTAVHQQQQNEGPTTAVAVSAVTDQERADFARDGYIIRRGVLPPSELGALRQSADDLLDEGGSAGDRWSVATEVMSPEAIASVGPGLARLAMGESVIKCPSPLNVLKDKYDHSCY